MLIIILVGLFSISILAIFSVLAFFVLVANKDNANYSRIFTTIFILYLCIELFFVVNIFRSIIPIGLDAKEIISSFLLLLVLNVPLVILWRVPEITTKVQAKNTEVKENTNLKEQSINKAQNENFDMNFYFLHTLISLFLYFILYSAVNFIYAVYSLPQAGLSLPDFNSPIIQVPLRHIYAILYAFGISNNIIATKHFNKITKMRLCGLSSVLLALLFANPLLFLLPISYISSQRDFNEV